MAKEVINQKELSSNIKVNTEKYLLVLKIYHYMKNIPNLKKGDLIFKFGKHKKLAEEIWECFHDLKIEWPYEIYKRVYED